MCFVPSKFERGLWGWLKFVSCFATPFLFEVIQHYIQDAPLLSPLDFVEPPGDTKWLVSPTAAAAIESLQSTQFLCDNLAASRSSRVAVNVRCT